MSVQEAEGWEGMMDLFWVMVPVVVGLWVSILFDPLLE